VKRKWAKTVHTLADEDRPCGSVRFIHKDGKEHVFGWATNTMSNDILAWFDNHAPTVEDGHAWIKSVVRDIYAKATKVIEHIGDYHPKEVNHVDS